jgi:hypothetical protein
MALGQRAKFRVFRYSSRLASAGGKRQCLVRLPRLAQTGQKRQAANFDADIKQVADRLRWQRRHVALLQGQGQLVGHGGRLGTVCFPERIASGGVGAGLQRQQVPVEAARP